MSQTTEDVSVGDEASSENEAAEEAEAGGGEGGVVLAADQEAQVAPAPQAESHSTTPSKTIDAPANSDPTPAVEQPKPAPAKKWVEDTERVWVEDKAAWTEQIPTYSTKEVSICNVCGSDITGNTAAHSKAHMLAGEGSGHHSEVRQEITGYDAINHPAEGHYETRVIGGHWE